MFRCLVTTCWIPPPEDGFDRLARLAARLLAVADAFSAMTTDRPYRKGITRETARRILAEGAGSQWDPACIAAFFRSVE